MIPSFDPLLFLLFPLLGAVAGFLAGLFGIGGGVLLVPLFLFVFPRIGFPADTLVHTALGTSLAIILPTAISATFGHRKRGNVDWHIVAWLALASIGGAALGSSLASLVSGAALKGCFGAMLVAIGLKFFLLHPHLPPIETEARPIGRLLLVGFVGGFFSSFFGIGGGVVTVPLMVILLRLPIHLAVGCSSAMIVVSAASAALGYVFHGWGRPDLAPYAMGYVCVPVAALTSLATIPGARFGVRIASALPQGKMVKAFASLMILLGGRMVILYLF
jgi:uncharacterized membrane protein YfcA